jgi:hypothetical protein
MSFCSIILSKNNLEQLESQQVFITAYNLEVEDIIYVASFVGRKDN